MTRLPLSVLLLATAVTLPAAAQPEPSARRLYLLCQMEDPSCGPMIEQAYQAAIANPRRAWTPKGVASCLPTDPATRTDPRPPAWNQIYALFMREVEFNTLPVEQATPRTVMIGVRARLGLCGVSMRRGGTEMVLREIKRQS